MAKFELMHFLHLFEPYTNPWPSSQERPRTAPSEMAGFFFTHNQPQGTTHMMTIKHIDLSGEEFVYPTTHVNFVPSSLKMCAPATSSIWRYDEDGRAYEIDNGLVFVMNEHGRTVARYTLSENTPVQAAA